MSTMVPRVLTHMPNVTRENVPVELATIGNMEFVVSLEYASLFFSERRKMTTYVYCKNRKFS